MAGIAECFKRKYVTYMEERERESLRSLLRLEGTFYRREEPTGVQQVSVTHNCIIASVVNFQFLKRGFNLMVDST